MNDHITRAVKQLEQASNNLSAACAEHGDAVALYASRLVQHIANALRHGEAYKTVGLAEMFDRANEQAGGMEPSIMPPVDEDHPLRLQGRGE